ncbi:hypothetical protein K435DRAFT_846847 [Dendrothele bispora CBS 962.96]|uniref:Uncharacterized protein n=1 Tax=Dendrothele bispora (strain CBS 962.96) TaxID=1314807 RepID=A0A4S8KKM9_DENBC|nr:hypothetical protein K435DRAFT_846847 [Dendrothele bispora CBS 962.96]
MEVNREIQYRSRAHRAGDKGRTLESLVKNIERVVDLVRREYLETFRPNVEMRNINKQLEECVGPGANFGECMQRLLGIVQHIRGFVKVLEARNWITTMLYNKEDLRVIQKYKRQLGRWRKNFNNEVERLLIWADYTTEGTKGRIVAGSLNDVRSGKTTNDHYMEASFTSATISNSTINNVGGNQTNTML